MHSTTLLKIKRKKKRTQNTLETERRKKRERKRTGIKLFGTEGKLQFTSVTTFTASVCVSFIFNFHFLLDHFSCIHEQRTSSPSYVCRLCHMKHAPMPLLCRRCRRKGYLCNLSQFLAAVACLSVLCGVCLMRPLAPSLSLLLLAFVISAIHNLIACRYTP